MIRKNIIISFDIDFMFWHLVPSVNINLHSKELEFEWMCIGIYISTEKQSKKNQEQDAWRSLPKNKSLFTQ